MLRDLREKLFERCFKMNINETNDDKKYTNQAAKIARSVRMGWAIFGKLSFVSKTELLRITALMFYQLLHMVHKHGL